MIEARQKGVRKVNEMKIKARENKWGPLRVHRMNWKVLFREITGWRPKNGCRTIENLRKNPHGNVTEVPRLGFSSSLLPLFIEKWGRCLPPSSPKRVRLLPPEATAFRRNFLEGPSRPGCYLHPTFTKYTPCLFFWWFFFLKVTETYEFRNDTCFLSVMLRNLVDYIIIPFLTYGMLRNLT